jgi:pyridinium-3,5-biscarboxylic acid mononucleotide sulfurtransferase
MTSGDAVLKETALANWMRAHAPLAIGFSGGVDSSYLAAVAVEVLGTEGALALIGRSESLAGTEENHAVQVAGALGIPVLQVETGELSDPDYAANPTNRCYFCKTVLWETLVPLAMERGFRTVVDGTNADDLHDYRPGAKAAVERGVLSPLAELGFTKAEIRERTRARGLPWWDRPSSPCLASRLPYGTPVTSERLRQVERAEAALRALGVAGNLRVRHHGELARVELDRQQLEQWDTEDCRPVLVSAVLSAGYSRVELDPRGFRSGSLNVLEAGATLPGH